MAKSLQGAHRQAVPLKLRYKLLIPVISLIIFFGVPELGLRVYIKSVSFEKIASSEWIESGLKYGILQHEYLEPDPILHWRLKPQEGDFYINPLRTRGREFSKKKPLGIFRIVCLGDSCTYGACVKEEEAYGRILEKMLNASRNKRRTYEVILAGVPGYGSYQGLVYLRERVLEWQPDLATVYFGNNNDYSISRFYDLEPLVKSRFAQQLGGMLDRSYFYNFIKSCLLKLKIAVRSKIDKNFPERFKQSSMDFIKLHYLKMAEIAREKHFRILFLNYPHIFPPETELGLGSEINVTIQAAAAKAGTPLVDIVSALNNTGGEALFVDQVHPTPAGHRIIAQMIFKTMLEQGIISKDDYDPQFLKDNLSHLKF